MSKEAERSVREVVADTVVALVVGGVVPNTETDLTRCWVTLGLSRNDLNLAAKRHREKAGLGTVPMGTWFEFDPVVPPVRQRPVEIVELPEPESVEAVPGTAEPEEPVRKMPQPKVRADRIGENGERELQCAGCNGWFPVDQFRPRADRPGKYTSRCRTCLSDYVKARYVSTKVDETVGAVHLRIVVDEESNLMGTACVACNQPLGVGDEANGEVFVSHVHCPPPPVC